MFTRRRRWVALGSALVLVAALIAVGVALPRRSAGLPLPAERIDPAPDGVVIKDVTPATADRASNDATVAAVLTDLNTFWAGTLPASFGTTMTSLAGGYQAVDSSASSFVGSVLCLTTPGQIAGNAYYCPTGDGIVFDTGALVPVLLGHYGPAGLAVAFAHEFGHAIQARIGPTTADRTAHPNDYPSLVIEAQGDCDAGAFLAWAVAGHAPHVHIPASSLVRAVGPILDFGDPETTKVTDPDAHGLSVDRLNHLLVGYTAGVTRCHALTGTTLTSTLGRAGVVAPSVPRYASVDAVLAAARTSVAAFAQSTVGRSVQADPTSSDLATGTPYGQFAQAGSLALAVGGRLTGTAAGAACFLGAWTASVFGHSAAGALGGWAGDADEALNMLRARPEATFADLTGFAAGFDGDGGCPGSTR